MKIFEKMLSDRLWIKNAWGIIGSMTTQASKNNAGKFVVEKEGFKIPEAAAYLGVSQSSVRRMIDRGELTPYTGLRHLLIPKWQLRKLLGME